MKQPPSLSLWTPFNQSSVSCCSISNYFEQQTLITLESGDRSRKFEDRGESETRTKRRWRLVALIIDYYARRGRVIGIYVRHDNPWVTQEGGKSERGRRESDLMQPWLSFNCYLRQTITPFSVLKGGNQRQDKWNREKRKDRNVVERRKEGESLAGAADWFSILIRDNYQVEEIVAGITRICKSFDCPVWQ